MPIVSGFMCQMKTQAIKVLEQLERWGAGRNWVGPDPYEGLNSPLGRIARSRRSRQAVIQLYKRLPLSPPWPLRAASTPNPKALALALSAYATPAGQRLPGVDEFLVRLPKQLEELRLPGHASAWSYPFDAQTRHLFYSRNTPNAIATCFVVHAFLDLHETTGETRWEEIALRARPYLLSLQQSSKHGVFFAYVQSGSELIHNANMLVSGALARLHRVDPDSRAEQIVRNAVETTLNSQQSNGLWSYGEADNLRWVDNFHTAYVLESLIQVDEGYGLGSEEALTRAVRGWRKAFFESDGWARYFPGSHFPLEAHCCASAIDLECALAGSFADESGLDLADRVLGAAIRELWLPAEARFAFKRTPAGLNRRSFMRWTNAPMFRALSRFVSLQEHGELRRRQSGAAAS